MSSGTTGPRRPSRALTELAGLYEFDELSLPQRLPGLLTVLSLLAPGNTARPR